jgi:hypothetical protein
MYITLVLATPDFKKTFIVQCDTSRNGIGIVLRQGGRHLAFETFQIKGKTYSVRNMIA